MEILILGVGACGQNIVRYLAEHKKSEMIDFMVIDSEKSISVGDIRSLSFPATFQLDDEYLALSSQYLELIETFEQYQHVFIITGSGSTGCNITKFCLNLPQVTPLIPIIIYPFSFEGKARFLSAWNLQNYYQDLYPQLPPPILIHNDDVLSLHGNLNLSFKSLNNEIFDKLITLSCSIRETKRKIENE